jgi:uncharacterized protein YndB with AHSA1/START domain
MASQVIVALRIRAAPQRVFEAFTQDIGLWWRPSSFFAFTPREPGVLSFEGGQGGRLIETRAGGKVFEVGPIKVWAPFERLVFGWRQAAFEQGQDTEVEVVFEPVGEETRVSVTHTGWDTVPSSHVAKHGHPEPLFLRRHAEWWEEQLGLLADHLR